jgi:hypothetical protein
VLTAGVECPCSLVDCMNAQVVTHYEQVAEVEVVLKLPRCGECESEYSKIIEYTYPIEHVKIGGTMVKLPHYVVSQIKNTPADARMASTTKGHFSVGVRS